MDGRSKPQANELAEKILARGELVTEANVLAVLALWRFKSNTDRQNVLPAGQEAVFSGGSQVQSAHTPAPSQRYVNSRWWRR